MAIQSPESEIASVPEQGQLVIVRQRNYTVTDINQSSIATGVTSSAQPMGQHLVFLSSIEDDALGEELQVVWELEPGTSVQESLSLPEPSGFDPPSRLEAFLNAVRWGAASTADIRSIQSPFRSGIDIEDYQLDPVVRAIQMPRVNLLIADDVGLGKTIEAGMVLLELVLRHRARKAPDTPRNFMHENRETSQTPAARVSRRTAGEGLGHTARMYVCEESDSGIVPMNHSNKDGKHVGGE